MYFKKSFSFLLIFGGLGVVLGNGRLEYLRHNSGNYEAGLYINVSTNFVDWESTFWFDRAVDGFMIHNSGSQVRSDNGTVIVIGNNGNVQINPGEWAILFYVRYNGPMPQLQFANFNGEDLETNFIEPPPPTVRPTRPPLPAGEYHYDEVIGLSLEFYEAQRCGKLPEGNRISWRNDSFLDDQDGGVDLVGGYFDAGDHVKFGFPFAYFTTVLNWGLIDFLEGYELAGQAEVAREAVKWSLDYFIKAHPTQNEFYGQTGDGGPDHAYWGRPEDWTAGPRRSYKITTAQPGSDLAGEAAAAFASGYLVFRDIDPAYATTLLNHASGLYDFADQYRGVYTQAIPASEYYNSWSGYGDELGWAAAWLYRATGNIRYLMDAERHFNEFDLGLQPVQFSWDDKRAGFQVLMAKISTESKYRTLTQNFCDWVLNEAPRSPKGMVYLDQWGSLRHASNVALICLNAAELGIKPTEYRAFAKQQIGYALGDSGRSFVCGYGFNPPVQPHHRASSCPDRPSPCDHNNGMNNPGANYQTLYGALVGGPDQNDQYTDIRSDYQKNEVATDYNAGFQGALAALHMLKQKGEI